MKLPEKIYPVEYAGFFDFNESGKYDDSVINRADYENAEEIANEMANRYNSAPDLLKENQELKARVQELENPLGGNYSPMQNMKNALKMVNEALQDGLTIEKNDPIHQVIERLL